MSNKFTISVFKKGQKCLVNTFSEEEKNSIRKFLMTNIRGFETFNLIDKNIYATFNNLEDEYIGKKIIINELEDIEISLDKSKIKSKNSNKKIDNLINETINLKIDSLDEIKNENNINDSLALVNTEVIKSEDTISLKETDTDTSKINTTPVLETKKKAKKSNSKEKNSISSVKPTKKIDEPTVEKQTVDEPTVEKQTVDEPTVEKQTVDEPTVDEPTFEELIVDESTVEKQTVDDQIFEELIVDEPIVNEPAVDEPTVENDKSETTVPKKKRASKKAISDNGTEKPDTVPKKKSTKKSDAKDSNEVKEKKVVIRTCSLCKSLEHDKRTCPKKQI